MVLGDERKPLGPRLGVETGLMALDGSIDMFS
jgi:hypothetical protein